MTILAFLLAVTLGLMWGIGLGFMLRGCVRIRVQPEHPGSKPRVQGLDELTPEQTVLLIAIDGYPPPAASERPLPKEKRH